MKDFKKDYSSNPKIRKRLLEVYKDVQKGFNDQRERANDIMDYWDIYNSKLGAMQTYAGDSDIYVPIVNTAIEARKVRFTNQVFPKNGRYVDVVTESGDMPYSHMALLEHYVDKAELRKLIPALLVQGDVEGQYSLYVDWLESKRNITYKKDRGINVSGMELPELDTYKDIKEEKVEEGRPSIEIIPDNDLLVCPLTVDSIDECIEVGGSVTIIRRMTKGKIQSMIDKGLFEEKEGKELIREMSGASQEVRNFKKAMAEDAGVRIEGKAKIADVLETWTRLKIEGKEQLCVTWFGSSENILGCKVCPYWCDRVPVISTAVDKIGGIFKGSSKVKQCMYLQYAANDMANMALDSARYSMLPIIMTDPEKNPRTDNMILSVAAVWETNPNDTQFAKFPDIWKQGFEFISSVKNEIFQILSVNPAMVPNLGGQKKMNQAQIANEQQVDLLTTADAVTVLEQGILSPLLQRFFDYDCQFRNDDVTIKKYGQLGVRAQMEVVTPIQQDERYLFKWFGVEQARSSQAMQIQIQAMNVLRGIPPEQMPGRQVDLVPLIENLVENAFGPRLAPQIFKDMRDHLSVEPEMENEMLNAGLPVEVHIMDDDIKHLKEHMEDLQMNGDPSGYGRLHIEKHQQQLSQKQQTFAMQQMKGTPGTPGGAGPGTPGQPAPGSAPGQATGMKGPPGTIHNDRMMDATKMPRNM